MVIGAALPKAGRSVLAAPVSSRSIPPHRAIDLPGVHAYADTQSVVAGELIRFHVSSSVPYQLSILGLGREIDDPSSDHLLYAFPGARANSQPIHPGSYAIVEKRIRHNLRAVTLECWVRPWNMTRLQGIISQEDKEDSRGLALGFGKGGYVGFFLGTAFRPTRQ